MFATLALACLLSGLALGYTSPRDATHFHHVLERSKLQAPESNTVAYKPYDVAEEFFHLDDDRHLIFQMSGEGRRSELRQTDTDEDESAWSVRDDHRMTGHVSFPTPASEMEEFTFMQVHCTEKPALRMVWMREYDGHSDAIMATLRLNAEDGDGADVERTFIGTRTSSTTYYSVTVTDKKFIISGNGREVELDASFWEDAECYFKAGVYIQHSEGKDDVPAVTKFSDLWWE